MRSGKESRSDDNDDSKLYKLGIGLYRRVCVVLNRRIYEPVFDEHGSSDRKYGFPDRKRRHMAQNVSLGNMEGSRLGRYHLHSGHFWYRSGAV